MSMHVTGRLLILKLPEYADIRDAVVRVYTGTGRSRLKALAPSHEIVCLGPQHFDLLWKALEPDERWVDQVLDEAGIEHVIWLFERDVPETA